jgi:hypothetical protein
MSKQILIDVNDSRIADQVQQELTNQGIHSQRLNPGQALRFGMIVSTEKVTIQVPPEEIVQLARAAPEVVNAFFDTLDRFRERIQLFINGEQTEVPKRRFGGSVKPLTIEQFMRGKSGFKR